MSDNVLRDLLLARLPASGLSAEEQAQLRDLLPAAQPGSSGHSGAVYMRSITAAGWRGIGPAATVQLNPGPGLTLVEGRNGTGKSSFAEAAEMAMTGDNFRWQGRTQVWKKGWRNLHEHSSPEVAVEFCFDADSDGAKEPVTVRRVWHGEGVEESRTVVERAGKPTGEDLHDVVDAEQLSLYRPFLPYAQLGAVINGPLTALHDEISRILGLELLSDTDAAARARAKALTETENAAKGLTATVIQELSEVDDPRAAEAVTALSARSPDLDAVRALLKGHGIADEVHLSRLRRLAALENPALATVTKAVARLRSAAAVAEDARHGSAEDARQLIKLLDAALEHRRRHPDISDCPVCGSTDLLDRAWVERTRAQVERLQAEAADAEAAHRELADAVREMHDLVQPPPAWLQADEPSLAGLWRDLTACRAAGEPRELADRAERAAAALDDACLQVRDDAVRRITAQDGRWQPVAARLSGWLGQAEAAQAAKPAAKQVKAVRAWLRTLTDELRDARFKPFADQSGEIWRLLCERSSVSLGAIGLTGVGPQRQVSLPVSVDDADAPAFGVMSQGELHSLALSLFIPRATHQDSPFGFVIIDDPVQSMDPEKVDGLARVLDLYAQHRQVVVFTHDTRLKEAISRLGLRATVMAVSRQPDSVVEVVPVSDPVSQALDEARAVALDRHLPPEVADRVLPSMCRLAVEAAYQATARRTLRAAGLEQSEIQRKVTQPGPLTGLAAIAMGMEGAGPADVLDAIARDLGTPARDLIRLLNQASHQAPTTPVGDHRDLVRRTERLTKAVQAR
ncbi:ATP-binding protein [Streptomyces sp. NBC_00140]|uniref:ATP-binding protein n=1 Tax=Streptomyces sp. NBC_00140 TaxID=2975664 RepID=UPI00225B9A56|nr:AAA family ATPase [Streptomyces sp. NBC_00140]MCX5334555.1 AAA family ATPase [Streptomyces sp. NBC_00140]